MTAIRNPNSNQLKELKDRSRRNEVANTSNATSITEEGGRMRVGPEGSGGDLNADGTMNWAGIVNFIGQFFQTGPSVFDGDVNITKNLDVTAKTFLRDLVKLSADLELEDGGSITVGGFVDMLIKNAIISYANGARILGSPGGVTVESGAGAQVQVSSTVASISSGTNSFRSEGTGNVVEGFTGFQNDVAVAETLFVNGDMEGAGIPNIPIAGAVSGALVRLPGGNQVYAAI